MAVLMMIAACYGVWQLAVLSSGTRTVRLGALFLAVAVGVYGAGVLSVFLQLLYTHTVAAVTGTPLSEVVSTASYTVDPLIEELAKVAPLALLVLLHKRIRAQWGLTDYVVVGAAVGSGFTLTEALLRFSNEAARMPDAHGSLFSGWTQFSGFSMIYFPGLPDILTSWVPAPVVTGDAFGAAANSATNPHLVLSALAGLGVGLLVRKDWRWRLAGLGLIAYAWLDHATFNQRIADPDGGGLIGLLSGPMKLLNSMDWTYPLLALAFASYVDYRVLKAGRLALPDVRTRGSLIGFATKGLPWTPLIAWRFELSRRNLFFARAAGADVAELHGLVRQIRARIDAADRPEAWRGVKFPFANPFGSARGLRAYWRMLIPLILLIPALLYFVIGTFPPFAGVQKVLLSQVAAPVFKALSLVGLAWLAWQLVITVRRRHQLRTTPAADLLARNDLQLMNGFGALALGLAMSYVWLTGTGLDQPILSGAHILEALGRALSLTGLLFFFIALALLFFPPGGALALAGGGSLGALSPAAAAGIGALLSALGIVLMQSSGGGKGDDYWEEKYRDETEKYEDAPRNQRISDANKGELQESGWLKERLPDADTRREFMKWLERGHQQGEPHTHLRPGSPEAEAALQEFLAEMMP